MLPAPPLVLILVLVVSTLFYPLNLRNKIQQQLSKQGHLCWSFYEHTWASSEDRVFPVVTEMQIDR